MKKTRFNPSNQIILNSENHNKIVGEYFAQLFYEATLEEYDTNLEEAWKNLGNGGREIKASTALLVHFFHA